MAFRLEYHSIIHPQNYIEILNEFQKILSKFKLKIRIN